MRHTRHWWLHTSVAAKEIPNLPEKSLLKTVVKIALSVEAMTLTPTDYPVVLLSQGTIKPTTETTLVSEVTGAVA